MEQLDLFQTQSWTVTELTRRIRQTLEADDVLQDAWVKGEISNFSRPASGHLYFTLKDTGASLRCVMWKGEAVRNRLLLKDGIAVEVHGRVSVYETGGQYQLYVDVIRPVGEGALYAEFMRLKAMLEAEGLFDPARKRPIPPLPKSIGIVTSATGAALRDILNTIRRRLPLADVVLAPSPVQGTEAPPALVLALQNLNRIVHPDVIIMARGGGSIEDLWAFNDERVVRAVVASEVPVISGVGHETDFTLVDFAADLRAPTPTAAAELATQITIADLAYTIRTHAERLDAFIAEHLTLLRENMNDFAMRIKLYSPVRRIQTDRQRIDDLARRVDSALAYRLELQSTRLDGLTQRLDALNPLSILQRGFAVVTRKEDGRLIHSVRQAMDGLNLTVRVSDGAFDVEVSDHKKEQ
jgi:exodeoxyribonuclease VII large subunit